MLLKYEAALERTMRLPEQYVWSWTGEYRNSMSGAGLENTGTVCLELDWRILEQYVWSWTGEYHKFGR